MAYLVGEHININNFLRVFVALGHCAALARKFEVNHMSTGLVGGAYVHDERSRAKLEPSVVLVKFRAGRNLVFLDIAIHKIVTEEPIVNIRPIGRPQHDGL